jgi:hypothetical protein
MTAIPIISERFIVPTLFSVPQRNILRIDRRGKRDNSGGVRIEGKGIKKS